MRNPRACKAATAAAAEPFTVSDTAMTPHGSPSTSTNTTVSPRVSALRRAATIAADAPEGAIHDGLPTRTARPATVPVTPRPGIARKSSTPSSTWSTSDAAAIAMPTPCSGRRFDGRGQPQDVLADPPVRG